MSRLLALLFCMVAYPACAAKTPIVYHPINLETADGTLYGSLVMPQINNPQPVALIIAGSGPTDRDGNNPMARNFALRRLAEALAENGIASVRYDKRGVAQSTPATPREEDLSVQRYVADIVGWSKKLRADPRFSKLILIGHSEGALMASLAANDAGADALITLSGSGRPIDEVLREQLATKLPPPLLASSQWIMDQLDKGQLQLQIPEPLMVLFRPSVQPYLITLFRQDPAQAFASVKAPALIIQGKNDIQVDIKDAEALKRAKPAAELALISGMNHMLRITPANADAQVATYNNPDLPLAGELVERMTGFIQAAISSSP
jgi:pimeloyl-ACP methyl ester carboxylesterase